MRIILFCSCFIYMQRLSAIKRDGGISKFLMWKQTYKQYSSTFVFKNYQYYIMASNILLTCRKQ
jgi:hypothetical protein